ncbi:hypothetical protein EDD69_1242 [Thermolongibacillus altinsuensis]|jgi:membrane protein implicated in regulation of membrane protease activity|uniref:Membrane protein NfeD2 N-terminal transmembrane domain-containing protein n=1 Tax=Thermolongibacillus altinsuensis TaxID=575256 RepID=A0A4R1QA39_9BACL|nr:NfeD family protein [Thermolongibacillus altinsuensis]TCL44276.1 hypothetical protein EDD69_1242 [Thermolongibacillus altinsuensis]GMB09218.1 putative membrane protein YuaF [Thermolongibacillus altinsuensis]
MFGYPMETVYLFVLIGSGMFTFLYIFFGDLLDAVFPDLPFFSPQLIFSFLTVLSASGFLFEHYTTMSSGFIGMISAGIGFIVVLLLHFFVFVPLKSAEASLNYAETDLEGRLAKVIVTVPKDGFGEILIQGKSGAIAKPAQSMQNEEIPSGAEVVIVEMKNGVALVSVYDRYEVGRLFT